MNRRIFIVVCIVVFVVGFAALHPIQKPKAPQDKRYVKLTNKGEQIPSWSGPWRCILDKKTGLVWEMKSCDESIHDGQSTFSWYDGKIGVKNSGGCFVGDEYCDNTDIITISNKQNMCGISSWRLPTAKELKTLIKKDARPGEPLINTSYFPYTKRGPYWTSDANKTLFGIHKRYKEGAVAISFIDAKEETLPYNTTCFVRVVAKYKFTHTQAPKTVK